MSATQTGYEYKVKTGTGRIANFVDTRVGLSGVVKEFGRKIFPDHWSFMFGEVALYSLVILLISGTSVAARAAWLGAAHAPGALCGQVPHCLD